MREGVKAFVSGSLGRLSGSYIVTVQLVSAQQGDALAAIRETAPDSSQLIAAVDRASKTLRRRIGESLRDLEDMPSLEQASTASLPALRRYTEGQRLVRQGERTLAIKRFEQAVALDTGFASAYVALAHGPRVDRTDGAGFRCPPARIRQSAPPLLPGAGLPDCQHGIRQRGLPGRHRRVPGCDRAVSGPHGGAQ